MIRFILLSVDFLTVLATCAALLLSAGLLMFSRAYRSVLLSLLVFSLGYLNFYLFLAGRDLLREYPALLFTNVIVAVNIGPLFYLYMKTVLSPRKYFQIKDLLYFITPLIIIAALLPFLTLPSSQKILLNGGFAETQIFSPLRIFVMAAIANMLVFALVTTYRFVFKTRDLGFIFSKFRSNMFLFVCAVVLVSLFMLNGVFSFFNMMGAIFLKTAPYNLVFSLIILSIYFLNQRFVYLFLYGSLAAKGRSKDLLGKIDTQRLEKRLCALMQDQHLYCDEALSLATLSRAAGLRSHQLSQYLNDEHGVNFNSYVNAFRINEAKRLIETEKDADILSIAFRVGFNSYSAFSAAFKKQTGVSPGRFRESAT